jgi:hypothetical protein
MESAIWVISAIILEKGSSYHPEGHTNDHEPLVTFGVGSRPFDVELHIPS